MLQFENAAVLFWQGRSVLKLFTFDHSPVGEQETLGVQTTFPLAMQICSVTSTKQLTLSVNVPWFTPPEPGTFIGNVFDTVPQSQESTGRVGEDA